MSFMSRLINKENILHSALKTVKSNGCPVVLCGISPYSLALSKCMHNMGINIDIVAVNRKFVARRPEFLNKRVVAIEDILARDGKYNYIMGFEQFFVWQQMEMRRNAAEIVFCDCLFMESNNYEPMSYEYCRQRQDDLDWLEDNLENESSKETLAAFLNQRLTGEPWHYPKVYHQGPQYFTQDIMNPDKYDVFLDCGAFNGDTVLDFLKWKKAAASALPSQVYAFEPNEDLFRQLTDNVAELKFCRPLKQGVGSEKASLRFKPDCRGDSKISEEGSTIIEVDTIDSVLSGGKADLIKMDIEGAELSALRGAAKTIEKYGPDLVVCLYHKYEDPFTIPRYIKSLNSSYKLYIRSHHMFFSTELVLYAVS